MDTLALRYTLSSSFSFASFQRWALSLTKIYEKKQKLLMFNTFTGLSGHSGSGIVAFALSSYWKA